MQQLDLEVLAKTIIDSNIYMVLGTADESGQPWVSPVYYASAGYSQFYWVSSPEVKHSQNIRIRPQVSIVIYDSRAPIGTGQGVYMAAVAEELSGLDLDRGIQLFSVSSLDHGGKEWQRKDVELPALYRLYRATALEHWVRDPVGRPDHRTPISI